MFIISERHQKGTGHVPQKGLNLKRFYLDCQGRIVFAMNSIAFC